ncbi:MAG: Uncharacterized protein AUK63_2237 [bacterium P3]|nr:MAG: Uncharacterized protein AUK63_2237 [bacterium P3]KWW31047.1 MAG: Uncharacterized protein F083_2760 [bacterium F083]
MQRKELKAYLDNLGIDEDTYSLEGDLSCEGIILFQNYSNWEVFNLSERGTRENFRVFHSEDEACRFLLDKFIKWKDYYRKTEKHDKGTQGDLGR